MHCSCAADGDQRQEALADPDVPLGVLVACDSPIAGPLTKTEPDIARFPACWWSSCYGAVLFLACLVATRTLTSIHTGPTQRCVAISETIQLMHAAVKPSCQHAPQATSKAYQCPCWCWGFLVRFPVSMLCFVAAAVA